MTRRRFLGLTFAAAMIPGSVVADLAGSRRQANDNHRCARLGATLERHGLTERERIRLERRGCGRDAGGWYSTRFYAAGR